MTTLTSVVENDLDGAFFSTWNDSPDNVWVVGGAFGKAKVLQFNGKSWTRHDTQLGHQLWWVHGFTGGPVFVSGAAGTIGRYKDGAWESLDSGVPTTVFYGIWGATPDDVWSVGGTWNAAAGVDSETDVVVHYDGTAWSRVTIDAVEAKSEDDAKDLFKVWGASKDAVFIVGADGMALHYDGSSWKREDTGTKETLFTVSGRTATDVYAIGGLGVTLLLHWDGKAWSSIEVPEFAPPQTPGLWTAPGQDVFIAGLSGYTARQGADGKWQECEIIHSDGYHGIRGDGVGVWVAGGDISVLKPSRGSIGIAGRSVPSP